MKFFVNAIQDYNLILCSKLCLNNIMQNKPSGLDVFIKVKLFAGRTFDSKSVIMFLMVDKKKIIINRINELNLLSVVSYRKINLFLLVCFSSFIPLENIVFSTVRHRSIIVLDRYLNDGVIVYVGHVSVHRLAKKIHDDDILLSYFFCCDQTLKFPKNHFSKFYVDDFFYFLMIWFSSVYEVFDFSVCDVYNQNLMVIVENNF